MHDLVMAKCDRYEKIILKTMEALGMPKVISQMDELPITAKILMGDYMDDYMDGKECPKK